MKIDTNNDRHFIADEGKVFSRISDSLNIGNDLYIGFTSYIGGKLLETPKQEVIEDFEEIVDPIINN